MARRWRSESTWRGYNEKTTNWLAASFRIARKKLEHQKIDGGGDNLALKLKSITAMKTNIEETRAKITKDTDQAMNTLNSRIAAVETNLEESNAKIKIDVNQDVSTLNARIDILNKDLADAQEKNRTIIEDAKAIIKQDITAVETSLEDSNARIKIDVNQAVSSFNARIDLLYKELAETQENNGTIINDAMQKIEEQAAHNMTIIKLEIKAVETNLDILDAHRKQLHRNTADKVDKLRKDFELTQELCERSFKEVFENQKTYEKNDGWHQNWHHHDWR